jgi:hypothetical protein
MKTGVFVDKGRELMSFSMKWGGFMEREQGAKKGGGRRGSQNVAQGERERGVGLRGKIFENVE